MLLGFKRQFAPFVEEGSKTHTIRAFGNRRPFRVGDRCDCYVDPRQKTMRLLGRWPCVRVQQITITASTNWLLDIGQPAESVPIVLFIDDVPLSRDEAERLLWIDGFRDEGGETYPATYQAAEFWRSRLTANKGTWSGQLIHWQYTRGARAQNAGALKRIVEVTARLNGESKALRRRAGGAR